MTKRIVLDKDRLQYFLDRKSLKIYQVPGLSAPMAYKMLRHKKPFSILSLEKLAAGLECDPLDLVRTVETPE